MSFRFTYRIIRHARLHTYTHYSSKLTGRLHWGQWMWVVWKQRAIHILSYCISVNSVLWIALITLDIKSSPSRSHFSLWMKSFPLKADTECRIWSQLSLSHFSLWVKSFPLKADSECRIWRQLSLSVCYSALPLSISPLTASFRCGFQAWEEHKFEMLVFL